MKLSTYNTVGVWAQPLKGNLGSFRNNNWSHSWDLVIMSFYIMAI